MNKHQTKEEQKKFIKKPQKKEADFSYLLLPESQETEDDAPTVVVVQGSKQSGKTTLIKSIIKQLNKHKITEVLGTITLRAGKNKRITLIECPNDISAMIDLAKIADIALIVIDASIGLEMETFEFLTILKSHGFPNVMGVLTHLDFFKDNKQAKKVRKMIKRRFVYEVGDESKLFHITGLKHELYPKHEMTNLSRFIKIMKPKNIPWKANHPYILIDRYELETGEQYKKEDNCYASFYGYIRGCSYRLTQQVHIVGLGDHEVCKIEKMDDPCPVLEEAKAKEGQNQSKREKKMRNLKESERIIYAPHSTLGFTNFDKAGFITIPDEFVAFTKIQKAGDDDEEEEGLEEGVKMVRDLQIKQNLNNKGEQEQQEEEDAFLLDNVQLDIGGNEQQQGYEQKLEQLQKSIEIKNLKQKASRIDKLMDFTGEQPVQLNENIFCSDISSLIYNQKKQINTFDSSLYTSQTFFSTEFYKENVKAKCVTGFEYDDQDQEADTSIDEEDKKIEEENKEQQKEQEQDNNNKEANQIVDNAANNKEKEAYLTESYGVIKRGTYVKITLKTIKYKHFLSLSPEFPLIFARINPSEDSLGFLKIRIKKHRWYTNILKSNDPLIMSIGWRRYQSLPVYAIQDLNLRYRFLKYTPLHEFCHAFFYGNFAIQNTGVLCTQSLDNSMSKFRIAATGLVLEQNFSFQVMKKLKLIGTPLQVNKNTAFIQGMFNSEMEVNKFEGASIRTVSGIRGQIKKSVRVGTAGTFRATFEDKILPSDIIFCRTWYQMKLEKFYNPIISYEKIRLMQTTWELKQKYGIEDDNKQDSEYKPVERIPKQFNPLKIPKTIEEELPFKSKVKVLQLSKRQQLEKLEEKIPVKGLTNENEKQVYSLIQRLNTIRNQKKQLKDEKNGLKKRIKESRAQGQNREREIKKKQIKKQAFMKQGQLLKKKIHKK